MDTQILNESVATFISANPWIILVLIWSAVWKLIALWKAAKNNHLTIFIIIALVNSLGVLEIGYLIYLYFKDKKNQKTA